MFRYRVEADGHVYNEYNERVETVQYCGWCKDLMIRLNTGGGGGTGGNNAAITKEQSDGNK